jgi:hypothetical protein
MQVVGSLLSNEMLSCLHLLLHNAFQTFAVNTSSVDTNVRSGSAAWHSLLNALNTLFEKGTRQTLRPIIFGITGANSGIAISPFGTNFIRSRIP